MPDGTEKHINPFTGTEVWFIPGRRSRPAAMPDQPQDRELETRNPEDYCNFCEAKYFNTPPEKARVSIENNGFKVLSRLDPTAIFSQSAEFRRIPNLFEIVTINYWKKNYSYRLSRANREWKERYLADPTGRDHVLSIIDMKLHYLGQSGDQITRLSVDEKLDWADGFFGGGHELIIPRRHYVAGATSETQLSSSGELSPDEHYHYFHFTIQSMEDIYDNNRYVRYIAIFQNWRKEAGASFDHLHKQLVALDEWGVSLQRELDMANKNPNIYNEAAANYAGYNNYVICENDYAVAFVEPGHRHPTVAIYSKSINCRPSEHTAEERRGFSDIVQAVHAATGAHISCNEEWYYMPRDSIVKIPWHVLIKWRINIPAGFEGGTKIYVNPMSLMELRDYLVPRLFELRSGGHIASFAVAEECPVEPNSLLYYRSKNCDDF
ncbi:DUF4921 family protein [candidate division KSB1 bacterium]|nr:DUF4921 family protein [candidate division KSB1 bacterium]